MVPEAEVSTSWICPMPSGEGSPEAPTAGDSSVKESRHRWRIVLFRHNCSHSLTKNLYISHFLEFHHHSRQNIVNKHISQVENHIWSTSSLWISVFLLQMHSPLLPGSPIFSPQPLTPRQLYNQVHSTRSLSVMQWNIRCIHTDAVCPDSWCHLCRIRRGGSCFPSAARVRPLLSPWLLRWCNFASVPTPRDPPPFTAPRPIRCSISGAWSNVWFVASKIIYRFMLSVYMSPSTCLWPSGTPVPSLSSTPSTNDYSVKNSVGSKGWFDIEFRFSHSVFWERGTGSLTEHVFVERWTAGILFVISWRPRRRSGSSGCRWFSCRVRILISRIITTR